MITSLSVDISDDPISGLKRKLVHKAFTIDQDLQMTHYREIQFYEKLPDGSYGRSMRDVILENETMNPDVKKRALELYQPIPVIVNTRDVKVNPLTGQPVVLLFDEEGLPTNQTEYDAAIPELQFWQGLPLTFIDPVPTTVSGAVYTLLTASMKASDNAGRV